MHQLAETPPINHFESRPADCPDGFDNSHPQAITGPKRAIAATKWTPHDIADDEYQSSGTEACWARTAFQINGIPASPQLATAHRANGDIFSNSDDKTPKINSVIATAQATAAAATPLGVNEVQ